MINSWEKKMNGRVRAFLKMIFQLRHCGHDPPQKKNTSGKCSIHLLSISVRVDRLDFSRLAPLFLVIEGSSDQFRLTFQQNGRIGYDQWWLAVLHDVELDTRTLP